MEVDEADSMIGMTPGLSIHAEELHSAFANQTFTSFRDIWIPLDLSNAASFNAVMAHAAADFSRCQGQDIDSGSLKYKTEAIGLVNKWLSSTTTAVNDDVFSGVLRLLTFEVLYIPWSLLEICHFISLPHHQYWHTPEAD